MTAADTSACRVLAEMVAIAAAGWLIGYVAGWLL